jgi:hypothetical protein
MSTSKSMSVINIAENASKELLNQVNEYFQIDFEPMNTLAAQFEVNLPMLAKKIFKASRKMLKNIQTKFRLKYREQINIQ